MTLILNGTSGLSDVDGSAATPAIRGTDANTGIFFPAADTIAFSEGGAEAMRINSSGNLGIGTTTPLGKLHVSASGLSTIYMSDTGEATDQKNWTFQYGTGVGTGTFRLRALNDANNAGQNAYIITRTGVAVDTHQWLTADTERMRIDSSGNLLVGITSNSTNTIIKSTAQGNAILFVDNGANVTFRAYSVSADGYNAAATAMNFGKNSSTNRSVNAGGTINASGADYAEYMTKASDFVVAKGDIVGINVQGKLTNVFADAVSFCVKSTDPSYVGGDVWGNEEALGLVQPKQPTQRQATEDAEAETDEEFTIRQSQYESDKATFDAALEAARQTVDRIAFAGQVPVNVLGATAGQYIIPVNDNGAIKGEAVSNPTFEQYQMAVGKVIAIESDGRAKIIVKVA